VGNGALMELADRYRHMVTAHGLEHWGAADFDYAEFIKGLKCISKINVCPGCVQGGGRDDCELRACTEQRRLETCVDCDEFPCCSHGELLEYMRTGAVRAGLTVIKKGFNTERLHECPDSELSRRWWWRALFEEL
jgi:hypothetical protein